MPAALVVQHQWSVARPVEDACPPNSSTPLCCVLHTIDSVAIDDIEPDQLHNELRREEAIMSALHPGVEYMYELTDLQQQCIDDLVDNPCLDQLWSHWDEQQQPSTSSPAVVGRDAEAENAAPSSLAAIPGSTIPPDLTSFPSCSSSPPSPEPYSPVPPGAPAPTSRSFGGRVDLNNEDGVARSLQFPVGHPPGRPPHASTALTALHTHHSAYHAPDDRPPLDVETFRLTSPSVFIYLNKSPETGLTVEIPDSFGGYSSFLPTRANGANCVVVTKLWLDTTSYQWQRVLQSVNGAK